MQFNILMFPFFPFFFRFMMLQRRKKKFLPSVDVLQLLICVCLHIMGVFGMQTEQHIIGQNSIE